MRSRWSLSERRSSACWRVASVAPAARTVASSAAPSIGATSQPPTFGFPASHPAALPRSAITTVVAVWAVAINASAVSIVVRSPSEFSRASSIR